MKNKYIGAGMAFRSRLKARILPIPAKVPMHDMWIGLIAAYRNKSALIPKELTLYRRHNNNASEINTKASFYQQLKWRLAISYVLFKRIFLIRKKTTTLQFCKIFLKYMTIIANNAIIAFSDVRK